MEADELLAMRRSRCRRPPGRPPRTFRPTVEVSGEQTRVLVVQTTAVGTERLADPAGRLSAPELRDVDVALGLVFGL